MSKNCPYCGEQIADSARKCRFCGEWLERNKTAMLVPEVVEVEELPSQETGNKLQHLNKNIGRRELSKRGDYADPDLCTVQNRDKISEPMEQPIAPASQQQPQVIVPQIIINNDISQNTEVEVEVEQNVSTGRHSSSSGWLYFELLCVGGVTWATTGKWWIGLITWVALIIGLQIPVLGSAICIVLGLGIGLLAGVISSALSAPTWACWVIGIIAAIVMCGINLEDKDAED